MLKDMLNEDRTGGLFRVILNILFVTLFIEGIGAYFIYMDVRGSLPGGTQQELFYAMFHAVSAFCNAGISTLSGNMYDPLVADKYNLHFWIRWMKRRTVISCGHPDYIRRLGLPDRLQLPETLASLADEWYQDIDR